MIVVSHYNEDISWLSKVKQDFIIYEKGEGTEGIKIENKGREGDTWLRYIIDWYDKLPEVSWLLQGNPFDHEEEVLRITENSGCGMVLPIGYVILNHKRDFGDLPIEETYRKIFNKEKNQFFFATGAQYGVNKKCILNKPFEWWENLYKIYCETPQNAWVFERLWVEIWLHETLK